MTSAAGPVVGIDIGGSGIKGAPVDLATGELIAERLRIPTPGRSTPKACADIVATIVEQFTPVVGQAPVGIAIPGPVLHGVIPMMANLDKSWVGVDADRLFTERLGRRVVMVNDADAAGLAEVRYGAARDHAGVVIVTTLGTGIGTAIINDGVLLPNTELGHIEIDGYDAESRASAGVKTHKHLSYRRWAKRLQRYYETMEKLFWPDLFVVGGGVSRSSEKFLPLLELNTPIVPATLLNRAGIVGAAVVAAERGRTTAQADAHPGSCAPDSRYQFWDDPQL